METAFREEKRDKEREETGVEEVQVLPGWGGWAGEGVRENKYQKMQRDRKRKEREEEEERRRKRRKDAALSHVIISEKVDKKAQKYLTPTVPYPFTDIAQYEASLSLPLGPDWNAMRMHRESVRPRVEVKQGVVIAPMDMDSRNTLVGKKEKRQKR
jgi:U3 small nucleolar RNA-associated protein 14